MKYLGQTTQLRDTTKKKKKCMPGLEQHGAVFEQKQNKTKTKQNKTTTATKKYFRIDKSPFPSIAKLWTNVSCLQWPLAARHGLLMNS